MKPLLPGLLLVSLALSAAPAQTLFGGASTGSGALDASTPSPSPASSRKKGAGAEAPQGPTIIDSQNMDYDEKTRIAIFTGDYYGVYVKDPSFVVYCDKLTAYMRKGGAAPGAGGKASPAGPPTPAPTAKAAAGGAAGAAASRGNGLQRAIAEGALYRPVVIVQDKPPANPGEQPQHNVGIAAKADYNADTGDVILTGWPRVSQGINTQIATAERTIMIMNRDGHTMKTIGPSRSIIQEQSQSKKADAGSPDQSPTPSTQ